MPVNATNQPFSVLVKVLDGFSVCLESRNRCVILSDFPFAPRKPSSLLNYCGCMEFFSVIIASPGLILILERSSQGVVCTCASACVCVCVLCICFCAASVYIYFRAHLQYIIITKIKGMDFLYLNGAQGYCTNIPIVYL